MSAALRRQPDMRHFPWPDDVVELLTSLDGFLDVGDPSLEPSPEWTRLEARIRDRLGEDDGLLGEFMDTNMDYEAARNERAFRLGLLLGMAGIVAPPDFPAYDELRTALGGQ